MHIIKLDRIPSTDPRLGRHINHDSRSRQFAHRASGAPLSSHRWQRYAPVLDQGNLGSCTGNAAVGLLATGPNWTIGVPHDLNEDVAVSVYSQATKEDPYSGEYPPTDTGSDGLTVAKVCKERGWINGYTHAFSLNDALDALQTGALITGTNWLNDMFNPKSTGELVVSGNVAGGHEYIIDEIDVNKEIVWMQNSWGEGWGIKGRAWMHWGDWSRLLDDDGDVTVFVPLSEPAPVPTPPVDDKQFIRDWLAGNHFFYKHFQAELRDYVT
jgi:hypothetical protein